MSEWRTDSTTLDTDYERRRFIQDCCIAHSSRSGENIQHVALCASEAWEKYINIKEAK